METIISINGQNTPHAETLTVRLGNWEDLYLVSQQYEYSSGLFLNDKRNKMSDYGVSMIILDFDDGMTLAEAIKFFSPYIALIVTTKSHQKNKNGKVLDRFRVFIALNSYFIDMQYYSTLMRSLTRLLGADTACTDPSRYYSPNPEQIVHYINGTKYFDIKKFDAYMNKSEIVHSKRAVPYKTNRSLEKELGKRFDLGSLLDVGITFYQSGQKQQATLRELINRHVIENTPLACHCFLNIEHEDKKPSCFIHFNAHNIYAKCVACETEGLLYKGTSDVYRN